MIMKLLPKIYALKMYREGIFLTLQSYYNRMKSLFFCVLVFNRTDMKISPVGSKIIGSDFIEIGHGFTSGQGLWLHAVINYPKAKQSFKPQLIIGDNVSVGDYVHIGCNNRIIIGDDVLMGSKIYITDHNHGVYSGKRQDSPMVPPANRPLTEGESVIIGSRCWIGEFATILPGVTIGEGCIIGSHSTVTHDIPANSIAVGSPAQVVKVWNESIGLWEKTKS